MSLLQQAPPYILAGILFLILMLSYIAGTRINKYFMPSLSSAEVDNATISSTMLGLLALLLAFSFGMANSRFEIRRSLVTDEANAIGTAILRTDVYPDTLRRKLYPPFRKYLQARMKYYHEGVDNDDIEKYFDQANIAGEEVWAIAAGYAQDVTEVEEAAQLLPALNAMLDLASSRLAAHHGKVPDSILYFLFAISIGSTFLLGYENKNPGEWIRITGFTLMLSLTIFSIIDLDRPHGGFIRLDYENERIWKLESMLEQRQAGESRNLK